MTSNNEICRIISEVFIKSIPSLADASTDADIFDLGATSLTIIDMQLQIEKILGVTVQTHVLMSSPSIDGWVAAYTEAYAQRDIKSVA